MPLPMYLASSKFDVSTSVKFIIAVAAGKGGVGKSTVTVNLAYALQSMGYHVGIMDIDIYGPSIRKMLPEDQMPFQKEKKIIPAQCRGIKMISMAYFRNEEEATVVRAPIANGIVKQFLHHVEWGNLDFLLVDFPPGTGDVQLTMSQSIHLTGSIMVTTPQEIATMDVRKAMHMFEQLKVPILGVVENMSYYLPPNSKEKVYLFGQGGGEKLSLESKIPFLGQIPIDAELCASCDLGKSLFLNELQQQNSSVQAFLTLAKHLLTSLKAIISDTNDRLQSFDIRWKDMP